jgi:hypothetical protein
MQSSVITYHLAQSHMQSSVITYHLAPKKAKAKKLSQKKLSGGNPEQGLSGCFSCPSLIT